MTRWHDDAILDRLESALVRGLDDAGAIAVRSERDLLSIPGPPPSAKGDPPHRRSGKLRDAQDHRVEREHRGGVLVVEGGASGPASSYASIVARDRPWLRKGVDRSLGRIVEAVADSLRRAV